MLCQNQRVNSKLLCCCLVTYEWKFPSFDKIFGTPPTPHQYTNCIIVVCLLCFVYIEISKSMSANWVKPMAAKYHLMAYTQPKRFRYYWQKQENWGDRALSRQHVWNVLGAFYNHKMSSPCHQASTRNHWHSLFSCFNDCVGTRDKVESLKILYGKTRTAAWSVTGQCPVWVVQSNTWVITVSPGFSWTPHGKLTEYDRLIW